MIEILGKHNTAKCFTNSLELSAEKQIKAVCDREEFSDSRIRIMPDVHAGKGCTIGTTMTITGKIVPGMVGVDIGCGMETVALPRWELDYAKLDKVIRERVPSGTAVRGTPHDSAQYFPLEALRCAPHVDIKRARLSIGTLGGGNHFIEVARDEMGRLFLVVHSGSRHLGVEVAGHYAKIAEKSFAGPSEEQTSKLIRDLKADGRESEIASSLAKLKAMHKSDIPKDLMYLRGADMQDYLHDMGLVQRFAKENRMAIIDEIQMGMDIYRIDYAFSTIHNYIDTRSMILRKGAVSAKKGERLLIPINMRDGSLICEGKGNDDWNRSAPHGAGRVMSRSAARSALSVDEYKKQMEGVYTTCVGEGTLDEAPMAYKGMGEIVANIAPTAEVVSVIKPVYNFKAS